MVLVQLVFLIYAFMQLFTCSEKQYWYFVTRHVLTIHLLLIWTLGLLVVPGCYWLSEHSRSLARTNYFTQSIPDFVFRGIAVLWASMIAVIYERLTRKFASDYSALWSDIQLTGRSKAVIHRPMEWIGCFLLGMPIFLVLLVYTTTRDNTNIVAIVLSASFSFGASLWLMTLLLLAAANVRALCGYFLLPLMGLLNVFVWIAIVAMANSISIQDVPKDDLRSVLDLLSTAFSLAAVLQYLSLPFFLRSRFCRAE